MIARAGVNPAHFNKQRNMPKTKLTNKQQAFCREYVKNGYNGTQAAISAGYSKKTANEIAAQNLTKLSIKEKIEHHKSHLEELLNISKSRIIKEHMKIAFSSIAHLHNTWITRKTFSELTDEQKECIEVIDVNEKQKSIKIKLFSKTNSLDSISKIMGYDAPTKHEVVADIPQLTTKLEVVHSILENNDTPGNE